MNLSIAGRVALFGIRGGAVQILELELAVSSSTKVYGPLKLILVDWILDIQLLI